jgi:hypothetical protein
MNFYRNRLIFLALGAIFLPSAGCGKQEPPTGDSETLARQSDLAEIYDLYAVYSKMNQRPPQKLADVLLTGEAENANPRGVRVLQAEEYVVTWGTDVNKQPEAVLAYQKTTATTGGWVLLGNGKTKQMTADEFKAAKK